jgi:hypothetical protein
VASLEWEAALAAPGGNDFHRSDIIAELLPLVNPLWSKHLEIYHGHEDKGGEENCDYDPSHL